MNRAILDIESDGLLDTVSRVHCISFQDLDSDKIVSYRGGDDKYIRDHINELDCIVGHNLMGYDIFLLEQFYRINIWNKQLFDTLVMSQLFQPDRQLPPGCPSTVFNPITGKKDPIGPHSLLAWTYRVDGKKPIIHDWRDQPTEVYIDRCESDVVTTKKVFIHLLDEHNNHD